MSVNNRLASDEGGANTPAATSAQNVTEHQLRERIKELSCLYNIAAILSDRTQSQAQLAQAFVARLIAGWQFSEVTCARLHLFDQIYTTSNFAETPWQLSSDVLVNEIYAGRLTVGYLVACPEADEGPFLQEERSLIDQCAWQLSRTIEGRQTQEAMVRRGDLLHSIVNATPDIIITVDRQARITYINRVLAGLTIEHVIGAPAIDYVDQPHRQLVSAAIDYVFATAQPTSYEIQAQGTNDNIAWYASRLAPLMQNGQVAQVLLIAEDITERKLAEQALAASERHFRTLFENMTQGVVYHETNGRISLANRAAEQILGLSLDQMQGRTSVDPRWRAVREDGSDFPGEEHPAMVALRTGKSVTDVLMGVYHPEHDEQRWLRIAAVPEFQLGETQPFRVFATFDDITERRRAEQTLARSEANYRETISAVGAIAYSIDYAAKQYSFISPGAEALTGYPLADITPDLLASMVVDSMPAGPFTEMTTNEAPTLNRNGAGETLWHRDYRMRTRNGEERWIYDVALQVLGVDGAPITAIGILQDITVRKRMEAALRASEERYRQLAAALEQRVQKRTAELQAQRDFANQIMDTLGQGLVVGDGEGHAMYVNPAMARLLDATPAALIGTHLTNIVAVEDLPMVNTLLPHRRQDEDFQFEVRLRTTSGQIKPVLVSTTPRRQAGAVIGRIAIFTDLTEIKAAETNLRQSRDALHAANTALEQALRMKDEFLASMSHELRTPLASILGLSEALQMQTYGALNVRQLRSVETIWESGQHLLTLINDILDLSKLAAEQLDIAFEQCGVTSVCQSSLSLIRGMALKKQLYVGLMIDPMDMSVRADPRRLKQMLVNLLSNAVKFTPAGGDIGLRVQGDAGRQLIEFAVWDKGIGIAASDFERIFMPFTQIDAGLTREYAGSGLGLTLVERMARIHGGTVSVASTLGAGSTFILTLPWAPHKPPAATSVALSPTHEPADIDDTSTAEMAPLLLLAEDDATSAEILTERLTAVGYRVAHVTNGLEAVRQAVTLRPNLILMDIQMPQLDGLQAIQHIRSHPDPIIATIPILALTAQAMPGDAEHCLIAGANAYLSKPFRLGDVLRMVATHVKGKTPSA